MCVCVLGGNFKQWTELRQNSHDSGSLKYQLKEVVQDSNYQEDESEVASASVRHSCSAASVAVDRPSSVARVLSQA